MCRCFEMEENSFSARGHEGWHCSSTLFFWMQFTMIDEGTHWPPCLLLCFSIFKINMLDFIFCISCFFIHVSIKTWLRYEYQLSLVRS